MRPASGVPRFRGMVGAHASFTLEERTLTLLEGICSRMGVGLHIHLAEGTTDREVSHDRGWKDPLDRLDEFGLVRPGSIFAHGVDLSPIDMQTLEAKGVWLIHCGRSNMNNGVGRAPVDRFPLNCGIGSDGLDDNMWGELRTTFFRGNEGGRGPLSHADAARFWLGNFRLAREIFGEPFGSLDAGAPADFILLDNFQKTPLTTDTWLGTSAVRLPPLGHPRRLRRRPSRLSERGQPAGGRGAAPGNRRPHLESHGVDFMTEGQTDTKILTRVREQEKSIISFLRDIVGLPSLSGHEEAVVRRVAREMETVGFDEVIIDPLGNVLGRVGDGPRVVAFDAHLDTVDVTDRDQWDCDPFTGKLEDGKVYGRGSVDQKAGMAGMVYAGALMKELGLLDGLQVWMVGSVMEEDCDGLCWHHILQEKILAPELVVSTEPTGLRINRGQRGRMEIRVRVTGRSCHGSMPHLGDNAIYKITPAIEAIEELNDRLADDPFLGKGTCTVTWIGSRGPSLCAVPDEAEFHIDRRLTLGETRESALAGSGSGPDRCRSRGRGLHLEVRRRGLDRTGLPHGKILSYLGAG